MIRKYLRNKVNNWYNTREELTRLSLHCQEEKLYNLVISQEDKRKYAFKMQVRWQNILDIYDDVVNFFKMFLVILVSTVICAASIILPVMVIGNATCNEYSKVTELETKWEFWSGCYVRWNDGWVLRDQLKFNSVDINK